MPVFGQENKIKPYFKVGDVSGGNYVEFETDGSKILNGNATTWTDFVLSATVTKQGATNKPDYDYTNLGLLFPQNDTAEKVYLQYQMDHRKKADTDIKFHLHYIQTSATEPTFTMEYKFYNNGEAVPGGWTTLNTSDVGGDKGVFTYSSGSMLQIAKFPDISPPSSEGVSAALDVILYRNDNDLAGDVLVKYIDFHYEIDSDGSRQEYTK